MKTAKSPKRVLAEALAVAEASLPRYSHRFSPKKFTLHQLFACLVLKDFYNLTYSGTVGLLADGESLSEAIGSFTDPEYPLVGLTEAQARAVHDVATSTIHFDETARTIIDGRTFGFCKLIVERATRKILGCHVVGERAVEITRVAAIAITTGMRVDELARFPFSFPTYAGILGRVAASVTRQLNLHDQWQTG